MGRLYEFNNEIENACRTADYSIRIPLRVIQLTEKDGRVWPLSFYWKEDGSIINVRIDKVVSVTPCAEQKSGSVGDRYECEIAGRSEYLFYGRLQPRKWFRVQRVSEDVYNAYYKLPREKTKEKNQRADAERE